MDYDRPIVLSIAGFDPTGGAGILADIKTFEQHQVLGMGILSANTIQTEDNFKSVEWVSFHGIKAQMEPIFSKYEVKVVKIGIVESLEVLNQICLFIKNRQSTCKIVWDPVIAASSGTVLHQTIERSILDEILKMIFLITPNTNEARILGNNADEIESAFSLSENCAVLLKGGHSSVKLGLDLLIEKKTATEIVGGEGDFSSKHGSGCILSAAIASNLSLGNSLVESCRSGKQYIEQRLKSNSNLLAYHVA